MQVQLEDQFYKRQRETHLVRRGTRPTCRVYQQAPSSVPMSPPLYHSTIQALENFHDSIEDVWIYVCIYKVAHTYKRFYICEDYIDVFLLSSTAIKAWKSQYWFIWRVLSPSGPFQALTRLY